MCRGLVVWITIYSGILFLGLCGFEMIQEEFEWVYGILEEIFVERAQVTDWSGRISEKYQGNEGLGPLLDPSISEILIFLKFFLLIRFSQFEFSNFSQLSNNRPVNHLTTPKIHNSFQKPLLTSINWTVRRTCTFFQHEKNIFDSLISFYILFTSAK